MFNFNESVKIKIKNKLPKTDKPKNCQNIDTIPDMVLQYCNTYHLESVDVTVPNLKAESPSCLTWLRILLTTARQVKRRLRSCEEPTSMLRHPAGNLELPMTGISRSWNGECGMGQQYEAPLNYAAVTRPLAYCVSPSRQTSFCR